MTDDQREKLGDEPAHNLKQKIDPLTKFLTQVGSLGFWVGLISLFQDGKTLQDVYFRALGAVGFVVSGLTDTYLSRSKRRSQSTSGFGVLFALLMAFDLVTTHPKGAPHPDWLTVAAIAIAAMIVVAIPLAVARWRRKGDERERAIANGSMAFAFIVTMVVVFAFTLMSEIHVGPRLDPSWILYAAGVSWFAAFFVLRRRM